jgi:hypothetical protein
MDNYNGGKGNGKRIKDNGYGFFEVHENGLHAIVEKFQPFAHRGKVRLG